MHLTSVVTSVEAWAPFWVKCVQGKGREGVDTRNKHTCEKLGLVMLVTYCMGKRAEVGKNTDEGECRRLLD